jgi:hypothetical protein
VDEVVCVAAADARLTPTIAHVAIALSNRNETTEVTKAASMPVFHTNAGAGADEDASCQ